MERDYFSASKPASYSHFGPAHLSWDFDNLRIGCGNQGPMPRGSSDSSPDLLDTSNSSPYSYYSEPESEFPVNSPGQEAAQVQNNPYFGDRFFQPRQLQQPHSVVLEESNGARNEVHNSTGDWIRVFETSIPTNMGYSFRPPSTRFFVNRKVEFFLDLIPSRKSIRGIASSNSMTVSVRVAHSSGIVTNVELEKMDFPGFRCSFVPLFAGRYFARLYFRRNEWTLHDPERASATNLHCPPLELDVNRNYVLSASAPTIPSIRLLDNGDKYWGITVDNTSDRLYISDRGQHDIIVIDPMSGTKIRRFGAEYLFRPTGMAMDAANKRMLICDKDNHRIVFASLDGVFISSFGAMGYADGKFTYPYDVAISPNGKIIAVADSKNHRIQFFDRFGNFLRKFTVFEHSPFEYRRLFDYPRGIVFGHDGKHVFVTDFETRNVVRLNLDNMEFKLLMHPGKLRRPQGIAIDDVGCLLVCDSRAHCINTIKDGDLKTPIIRVGHQFLFAPTDIDILRGGQVAVLGKSGIVNFF